MKRNSMYTKGDFHIHSTYSDGSLTPSQVVRLAKERHVDIMAITDHNNTDGIDEAIIEGRKNNITVIPGVELSTRYNDCRVHVLGYFKDESYKSDLLKEVLLKIKQGKIKVIRKIFQDRIDFCGTAGITDSATEGKKTGQNTRNEKNHRLADEIEKILFSDDAGVPGFHVNDSFRYGKPEDY